MRRFSLNDLPINCFRLGQIAALMVPLGQVEQLSSRHHVKQIAGKRKQ